MPVNLDEYIQRIQLEEDLFSKAHLLEFLVRKKGYSIKQIAQYLGLSSSYICNLLRMLKLPELIRDGYYAKLISMTHLSVLSRLSDEKDMVKVYEEILSHDLSTLELEERVREILHNIQTDGEHIDAKLKEQIIARIHDIDPDIQAKVIQTRIKAKIILELKGSLAQTSKILKKVSGSL
jgi:ParB family chromosome partitioning protein